MPVQTELRRDGRVFQIKYIEPFAPQDVPAALSAYRQACDQARIRLHSITDTSSIGNISQPDLSTVQPSLDNPYNHPRTGVFVVVVRTNVDGTMVNTLSRMMPGSEFRVVHTLDTAFAEIEGILAVEEAPKVARA